MSTRVIGIDASWTGLGIVSFDVVGGKEVVETKLVSTKKTTAARSARLDELGSKVMAFVESHRPASVAIENYAYGAAQGREMAGELGGHIKWLLWCEAIPTVIVPPTTLKAFVTGKGVAPKELMMMTTLKKWGFESPDNNICDAYCLARFAWALQEPEQTKAFEALRKKCEAA